MDFELFERKLLQYGYGIVACNHYSLHKVRHLYCVIMHKDGMRSFKAEGQLSGVVFERLVNDMNYAAGKDVTLSVLQHD